MFKRPWFWIVAVLVLLAAATAMGMQKKKAAADPALAQITARAPETLEFLASDVVTVQPIELRQTLALSGSLRAVNQATVKARVAGDVQQVLVREGEAVQAGQVLVKMDVREYRARAEQARGALLAAKGQMDIATKSRDNNRALLEKNFISKNAYDNAESQFEIARANVESARAALDVAEKSQGDTVIRAPIAGVVAARNVQPGEKVPVDARLIDLVDLRAMELEGAVPTSDIMNVALGQEVQVSFAGLNEPVTGRVVRINPATQAGSRSILAYVHIDNPDGKLKVGMFGEARLTLQKKSNVLAVPQTALRSDAGNSFVYAIEDNKVVKKPLRLGMAGNAAFGPAQEVLEGLAPGARVVAANLGDLKPGTLVKINALAGQATAAR